MSLFKNIKNLFQKDKLPEVSKGMADMPPLSSGDEKQTPKKPSPIPPQMDDRNRMSGRTVVRQQPELTALEMAEKGEWEGKALRTYQKGDVILDTYEVEDVLSGAMGYVYIANHRKWKVKMAIKSPNEEMLKERSLFSRVLKEADAWTGLGLHLNIAYCYYVRQLDGIPHIFIEYVDGGNLREWIAERKCYDLKVGLDLAIQFCHGMGHAHSLGKIHRDIKPENILMTEDGILKVTDFGLVKIRGVEDRIQTSEERHTPGFIREGTQFAQVMGTLAYMSPEQYETPLDVNVRTDLYSFGVCLYEMFCGRIPYDQPPGEIPAAVLAKLNKKPPCEPQTLRNDIPAELSTLLKRCVALDREDRYPSSGELREDLIKIYRKLFNEDPLHEKVDEMGLKADGLNNRAVSYIELGREDEAVKCWEDALKEDPAHLEANFNYGYLRWKRGEILGYGYVAQILGLEKSNGTKPDYWQLLGWIHLQQGDVEEVERIQNSEFRIKDEDFLKALQNKNRPVKLLRTFEGHTDGVNSVSFSPDGRYALSGSYDDTVRLWEVASGREVRRFEGDIDGVKSVSFSPDGQYALSGDEYNTLRLLEFASGRELIRFEGDTGGVKSVSFSPDGRYALSGNWDKTLMLWDVSSGREIKKFEGHTGSVDSVSFSPDGQYALSGSSDNTLRLWEVARGQEVRQFEGHTNFVTSVCFSPDGCYALSGSADRTLRLWEVASGKEVRQFEGHTGSVDSVSFSPDGQYALSGSSDKTLRLWEVASGQEVRQFEGHTGGVNSVSFSPDGQYALSGSSDRTLRLWKVHSPEKEWGGIHPFPFLCRVKAVTALRLESEKVRGILKFSRDAIERGSFPEAYRLLWEAQSVPGYERDREILNLLSLCGVKGNGRGKGLKESWYLRTLEGHTGSVDSVCFSSDGRYALSGSEDKTLMLWDVSSGREIKKFEGHTDGVTSVCFSSDGLYILSGSGDKTLRLWEVASGREIKKFEGHTGYVSSVSFSPDGQYALSGSSDKTLRLWEVASGREVRRFEGHTYTVTSVSFSPDGCYALSGSDDNTLRLWEVTSGREVVRRFEGDIDGVNSVSFSPNGRYALSGSDDGTVRLWEVASGREVRRFEGHNGSVNSVSFSPDGRYALSGSNDNTLRLREVASGREVRRFEGHTGNVSSVCFSPDGRYALSGSRDKTLKLWEFDWEWEFEERGEKVYE